MGPHTAEWSAGIGRSSDRAVRLHYEAGGMHEGPIAGLNVGTGVLGHPVGVELGVHRVTDVEPLFELGRSLDAVDRGRSDLDSP